MTESSQAERNEVIEYMNSKYAVVKMGGKVVVLQETTNEESGQPEVDFLNPSDLKVFYKNKQITFGKEKISWCDFWLNHPARRTYEKVIFHPDHYEGDCYNLYRGLSVQPKRGTCDKFWEHIRSNICCRNEEIFHYIQCWMADCIQNPLDRKGVALVLKGRQGTGKGVVANIFGKLFGRHFKHITNQRHLIGNFNAHLKDALFLFVDEAFWAGDKQGQGVLKSLITEKNIMIEQKGKDAFMLKNYTRIMMASNEDWVAPVELDDRRYFVLEVSDVRRGSYEYFRAIYEQMQKGGYEAMLYDLLHMQIDIDLRKFPKSHAIREQKINSFSPIQHWWFNILEQGIYEIEWKGNIYTTSLDQKWECPARALFEDYLNFTKEMNFKSRLSLVQFGIQVKNLAIQVINKQTGKNRIRIYTLNSIKDCRIYFELNSDQEFFPNSSDLVV